MLLRIRPRPRLLPVRLHQRLLRDVLLVEAVPPERDGKDQPDGREREQAGPHGAQAVVVRVDQLAARVARRHRLDDGDHGRGVAAVLVCHGGEGREGGQLAVERVLEDDAGDGDADGLAEGSGRMGGQSVSQAREIEAGAGVGWGDRTV